MVLVRHGHLIIGNGLAGRGEMQVQDRGDPGPLKPRHIIRDGCPVVTTGVGPLARAARPPATHHRTPDPENSSATWPGPIGSHRPYSAWKSSSARSFTTLAKSLPMRASLPDSPGYPGAAVRTQLVIRLMCPGQAASEREFAGV